MTMRKNVRIERRFLRSVRIDSDLGDSRAINGFVCPESYTNVLLTMFQHIADTRQGAFTWTGPYGSGKSSLIVMLGALLGGNKNVHTQAVRIFGRKIASKATQTLPSKTRGWRIIPVIGRQDNPVSVIGEAIHAAKLVERRPRGGWTEPRLVGMLTSLAEEKPRSYGGIILFIDEMGKLLESASRNRADIYILQQLAEVASRSNKRFIIIGALHQAFEEYANRVSYEIRDEWAKIQGRFIDLPIHVTGEEQIDLVSRAITSNHKELPSPTAKLVARLAAYKHSSDVARLAAKVEACWPLNPVVAHLIGPLSRRRFGQNQRSIFGFLNSSEPHGFQDFLNHATDDERYGPERLWDYLRVNLEPSILASPDGHRWALAADAVDRCESRGGDELHVKLLKSIAVIDFIKDNSRLVANHDLLQTCMPEVSSAKLGKMLGQLKKWSFIIFRKHIDAYAVYAGSDFDIDAALQSAMESLGDIDTSTFQLMTVLQPILAKRHYHETGTMRWFEMKLMPVRSLADMPMNLQPENGAIGQFILAIPTEHENMKDVQAICSKVARRHGIWDVIIGVSEDCWGVMHRLREMLAMEKVQNNNPALEGDAVARREVLSRLSTLQSLVEADLMSAVDNAQWYCNTRNPKVYRHSDLNMLASKLASKQFDKCPILHNELLNRHRPSSSAIAAQNVLLRSMIENEGEPNLGIEGFPAEKGLLVSILKSTGMYEKRCEKWRFGLPNKDSSNLTPMWKAAEDLCAGSGKPVGATEIYELWSQQPFGLKRGVMLVLLVAFILSQKNKIAIYREGMFRPIFDDVDIDYLTKDPASIQLRWMNLSDTARLMLSSMADVVRDVDKANDLVNLEPMDVARNLVSIYETLPGWTKRTTRLSTNAIRVRETLKKGRDANQLLFDDMPKIVGKDFTIRARKDVSVVVKYVHDGIKELTEAYMFMLVRLQDRLLSELQVPNMSEQSLKEMRERADNIRQVAGDFHLDAFVGRVAQINGIEDIEGIASLVINKPLRDWVDLDIDRAAIEMTDMAQRFLRTEIYARVKGRKDKRQAMAVVVGINGSTIPLLAEFEIADTDRAEVSVLIQRVINSLESANKGRREIILAALAELGAYYMQPSSGGRKLRSGAISK